MATSHSPRIRFALDQEKQHEPVWSPIFEAYEPVRHWLKSGEPGVDFYGLRARLNKPGVGYMDE